MTKLDKAKWDGYIEWLFDLEYHKLGLPEPKKTIFLDMPIEISQKLLSERYGGDESKKDVHERNIIFMEHCREAALYVGKRCGWEIVNCSDNGQPRSIDEIQDEICKITQKTIQENTNA